MSKMVMCQLIAAVLLTAAFIAAFFVSMAQAQISMQLVPMSMACGPHADLREVIEHDHKERLLGRGLARGEGLAELFVSAEGGWSFILTPSPDQPTCVLVGGEHWQILDAIDDEAKESAEW
jgi:hypothetical protein